jgi:hypothetical protein
MTEQQPVYRVQVALTFYVTAAPECVDSFDAAAYARDILRAGCPLDELSDVGLPAARIEAFAVTLAPSDQAVPD